MKKTNYEKLIAAFCLTAVILMFLWFIFGSSVWHLIGLLMSAAAIEGILFLASTISLKRLLSFGMACLIIIAVPLQTFATEQASIGTTTATTSDSIMADSEMAEKSVVKTVSETEQDFFEEEDGNDSLTQIREEIALVVKKYQLSPDMTDQDLANSYFVLDSDGAKDAWETADRLFAQAERLTLEERISLAGDENTKLCLRAYGIMVQINQPMLLPATTSGTLTSGLSASAGGAEFTWSLSSDKISVIAGPEVTEGSGCDSDTYKAQTGTLTVKTTAAATLTVSIAINGSGLVKLNGEEVPNGYTNTYSLEEDGTLEITISNAPDGSTENVSTTLTLKYTYVPVGSNVELVFQPVEGVPYSVNGTPVVDEKVTVKGDPADGFTVTADSKNYTLAGATLKDADGNTSELTAIGGKLSPMVSGTVTPSFGYDSDADGIAPYLVDNKTYWDWDIAMTAANNGGKLVILNDDHTLPKGNYSIPSGVTLLIPYNDTNTLITKNMENFVGKAYPNPATRTMYRQLTMSSGANIAVESGGAISIGSIAYNQMKGQVGPYGAITMDSNSSITIKSGANLYAWGYIFHGANGGGTVTVQNGGTVYESASITDYPNSAGTTLDLYNGNTFPLRSFTVRNIEVPLTISSGAEEYIFYCLYSGTFDTNQSGYVNFIGNNNTFAFQPLTDASITKEYVNGRQKLTLNGNVSLNPLKMDIKNILTTTVSSSNTSGFPLPSEYDITVASGTLTLYDKAIATEGCTITIANGATIDANGNNLYVLDSDDDKGPGKAESCPGHGADYTWVSYDVHNKFTGIVDKDAVLDVNGTLIASGEFYTSTGKAAIISSKGTGIIKTTTATTAGTLTVKYDYSRVSSINVYSASLLNGDGSYTETEDGAGTYKYSGTGENGRWILLKQLTYTNIKAGDCLDIFFYTDLYGEGYKAKVTRERANEAGAITYSTEYIPASQWSAYGNNQYRFAYQDIAAKEMSDTVTVTIYDEHDRQLTHPYSESVEGYAVRALKYYAGKTDMGLLQTALVDMLNYGAAAQSHFKNYRTDVYANRNIDSYQGIATADVTYVNKDVMDDNESTYKLYGTTLTAESEVYLTFYFTGITAENKDSMSATAEYTTIYGKKVKQTIQGSDFNSYTDKDNNTTYYGPCVTGIAAADGKQTVSCTLNYGTGTTTVKSDIESYVARTIGETVDETTLDKLCLSLMKFVVSAKAYFESTMG